MKYNDIIFLLIQSLANVSNLSELMEFLYFQKSSKILTVFKGVFGYFCVVQVNTILELFLELN